MNKATQWKLAGKAVAEGLVSSEYHTLRTVFMCDVVGVLYGHGDESHPGHDKHQAYTALWNVLKANGGFFGLLELLVNKGVVNPELVPTVNSDAKQGELRLKVGRAFWGAVVEYINSVDKPNLAGIKRAGYAAVKALNLE